MFLTDLQEKLRDVQTERGNVPLSRAHVMHEHTTLVAHGDIPDDEPAGEAQPETENPHSTYTTIPREEYRQLLEIKAEYASDLALEAEPGPPAPDLRQSLDLVPAAMFIEGAIDELAKVDGNQIVDQEKELHVAIGPMSEDLRRGYNLGLQTARVCLKLEPATQLAAVMNAAAAKLPTEVADLEGKGKEVRMPCPQWDGKGHACELAFGHEGDHVFETTTLGPVNVSGSASTEGGETVTIPIPDTPKE